MLVLTLGDLYIPERAYAIPEKFRKLLQQKGRIDRVWCLGNASSSRSTVQFLQGLSPEFQMVRGESDTDLTLPQSLVFAVHELKVGILNGFQVVPKNDPLSLLNHARMMDVDVLLYGSTHRVEAYTLDGKFFVNPGTASGAYCTDALDPHDQRLVHECLEDGQHAAQLDDYLGPCPSFCLLDIDGRSCTLYLYTLVDDEVKIDRLNFLKPSEDDV